MAQLNTKDYTYNLLAIYQSKTEKGGNFIDI